jgi:DNA polymerase-4
MHCPVVWPRAIILVDMDAFFASIEQRDFPELRDKPIGVTNGMEGSTIITSSYEARAFGIKTGMRVREAKKLCPAFIQRPSRPEVYAETSCNIMYALQQVTPDIEVFSVDEAFLDVTHCQQLHGTPARMLRMAKQIVQEVSGVTCSAGLSGDKTTAKFAAKLNKPDGIGIIPPWEAKERLHDVPATKLCGVADGIGQFLANHGARTCGEVGQLPISVLAKRFGNIGRRIWLMCRGEDPDTLHTDVAAPKSIGHGKVVPPGTRDREVILTYLMHMSEKVATRLRRHEMEAQQFLVGVKTDLGWLGDKPRLAAPTDDGRIIFMLCRNVLQQCWRGEAIKQVQVTALAPCIKGGQLDMFSEHNHRRELVNQVMDRINDRYGESVVAPGRLLNRSTTPNVISPAWKPFGHRKTI